MKNVQQISFDQLFTNYASAELPPFRSRLLDVKDAQCDKKMMGVKFQIMFGRHNRPNGVPLIQLSSQVANFAG